MKIVTPTREQAPFALCAMKTVALANGALDRSERQLLELGRRLLGLDIDIDDLPSITPEALAERAALDQLRPLPG